MENEEQPATKQDVQVLKQDVQVVKQDLQSLGGNLRGELAATERRLVERIDDVEKRFITTLDERLERMETRLLTGFEKWANPTNNRIRRLELTGNLAEDRLTMIEERLRDLEKRNPDNPAA